MRRPAINGLPQDDLSRQRRLNHARCPDHGWILEFLRFSPTGRRIVKCPYVRGCDFVYVLRPESKTERAFNDRILGAYTL
jgi:hypothetical protein